MDQDRDSPGLGNDVYKNSQTGIRSELVRGFWKIPAPINVMMDSFNFKNILRWNRPANLRGDVIYTVEYKMDTISATTNFKTICVTREQQCDSSAITYKSYVRVKAQLNSSQSEWTTIHFDPFSESKMLHAYHHRPFFRYFSTYNTKIVVTYSVQST
ncbi:hypothetical protein GDO81_023837 [Engystomops pustulosus]|uniref:Fibronectin type-III domain-containing protein n=1 Tax=Engystomops pustulosus TaxID=76066 RepID=A0AAV6YKS1_ENGPU|nr:hypothetical protein GDO81_023837 [Engystomops pustulosus]